MFLLTVFIGTSFVGCKEPDITVTSLSAGKAIPAPVLLSNGLVNDFPDSQKYLQFTGSCHSKIDGFEIAYLKGVPATLGSYNQIPAATFYDSNNDTANDTNSANDLSCADGTYDFVVSIDQLLGHLGLTTVAELKTVDVEALYIRGIAGSEYSLPMILSTGGGDSEVPKYLTIETRDYDRVIESDMVCAELEISFLGESSSPVDTNKITAGSFSLETSVDAGATYTGISLYANQNDCENDFTPLTSWTVNPGSNNSVFVNTLPYVGAFRIRSTSANLTFDGTNYSLINKSPQILLKPNISGKDSYRFLLVKDLPHKILNDLCYAFNLEYLPDNTTTSPSTLAGELSSLLITYSVFDGFGDSTTSSPFTLYTDASCASPLISQTLSWSFQKAKLYIKYNTGTTGKSYDYTRLKIKPNSTVMGKTIFPSSKFIYSEKVTSPVPEKAILRDYSGININSGRCYNTELETQTASGDTVTSSAAYNVIVSSSYGGIRFFEGHGCNFGNPNDLMLLDVSIPVSVSRKQISYRIEDEIISALSLESQIGVHSAETVTKYAGPAVLDSFLSLVSPIGLTVGTCYSVDITPSLETSVFLNLTRLFTFPMAGTGDVRYYSIPGCGSGEITNSALGISFIPISNAFRIYYKVMSPGLHPFEVRYEGINLTTWVSAP